MLEMKSEKQFSCSLSLISLIKQRGIYYCSNLGALLHVIILILADQLSELAQDNQFFLYPNLGQYNSLVPRPGGMRIPPKLLFWCFCTFWSFVSEKSQQIKLDQEAKKQPTSPLKLVFHSCFVTQCLPNKFGLKVENFNPNIIPVLLYLLTFCFRENQHTMRGFGPRVRETTKLNSSFALGFQFLVNNVYSASWMESC